MRRIQATTILDSCRRGVNCKCPRNTSGNIGALSRCPPAMLLRRCGSKGLSRSRPLCGCRQRAGQAILHRCLRKAQELSNACFNADEEKRRRTRRENRESARVAFAHGHIDLPRVEERHNGHGGADSKPINHHLEPTKRSMHAAHAT